ncbi:hypothetical protein FIBSPDRAFT_957145 [Athelia psychrophila]|uniref:DUF1996 domain-containing protein n=1 Tax=Athelia psychrophila TaxID=1759441 RepID=A0A166G6Y5_9AGAM|nr:hypothetical protein FIBSPDRAFT_957145 [Fibularhizoctonia sp. CBS 109695]
MRVAALFAVAAGVGTVPVALAWGAAGHEMVTTIAQIHLYPSADRVDHLPQYRWTGSLHYVEGKDDYPNETYALLGNGGWVNGPVNLLNGIAKTTHILEEWDGRDEEVGSVTNDHSLGRPAHRPVPPHPAEQLHPPPIPETEFNLRGAIYDPYVRRVMWEGIMGRWKGEVQQWLSCPSAFPAAGNGGVLQTVMDMFRRNRNVAGETDDDLICPHAWAKPINAMNCDAHAPRPPPAYWAPVPLT